MYSAAPADGAIIAYGLPKETARAIIMLHSYTKDKVRTPEGDTYFFNMAAGVLQGDTLPPYLFIISLDHLLTTSIDLILKNGFTLKKRSRWYSAETITDTDYADDVALLANTPTQAESPLQSLEQAAGGISLLGNANKTEYMCFNPEADIFTRNGGSLILVDMFTYLGSSVSSTESDISMRQGSLTCPIK